MFYRKLIFGIIVVTLLLTMVANAQSQSQTDTLRFNVDFHTLVDEPVSSFRYAISWDTAFFEKVSHEFPPYYGGGVTITNESIPGEFIVAWAASKDLKATADTNLVTLVLERKFPEMGGEWETTGTFTFNEFPTEFVRSFSGYISGTSTDDIPVSFKLEPRIVSYPNPSNPTLNMRITVPTPQYIRVDVYDVTGRQVATYFDGFVNEEVTVTRETSNLSSGTYFLNMSGHNLKNPIIDSFLVVK